MLHSDLGHLNLVIFKAIVAMLSFVLRKLLWLVIIAEWIITGGRKEVCNGAEMTQAYVLLSSFNSVFEVPASRRKAKSYFCLPTVPTSKNDHVPSQRTTPSTCLYVKKNSAKNLRREKTFWRSPILGWSILMTQAHAARSILD